MNESGQEDEFGEFENLEMQERVNVNTHPLKKDSYKYPG
jgi:hypothetical protein